VQQTAKPVSSSTVPMLKSEKLRWRAAVQQTAKPVSSSMARMQRSERLWRRDAVPQTVKLALSSTVPMQNKIERTSRRFGRFQFAYSV
jgi:hypothetical protein